MSEQRFQKALKYVNEGMARKQYPDKPELSNDNKLKFYGLFKTATIGVNETSKPGIFDPVGRAKWQAWTDVGDITKEEAMKKYCELLDQLAPGWEAYLDKSA